MLTSKLYELVRCAILRGCAAKFALSTNVSNHLNYILNLCFPTSVLDISLPIIPLRIEQDSVVQDYHYFSGFDLLVLYV